MNTGDLIRHHRKLNNLSMKKLGELIGVSEQAISQYERGLRTINLEAMIKIADILNIPITDLISDKSILEKFDKAHDLEKLHKDSNEIQIIENLLSYYEYKINYIQVGSEEYEIELINLKSNETKILTESEYQHLRDRLRKFIDFEFSLIKKK